MENIIKKNPSPNDCLNESTIMDYNHLLVDHFFSQHTLNSDDRVTKLIKLYYAVRDTIRYNPYASFFRTQHYQASYIIKKKEGFCVSKAALLCALGRKIGIPARIGFADVRNHLVTKQLQELLGSNLFVYHGFVEFFLHDKWVKATPAFNKELCRLHNVLPLEFNAKEDSIFQPFDLKNNRFMDYVKFHGTYTDIPLDQIIAAWKKEYGEEKVNTWMQAFDSKENQINRNFYDEEVIT